MLNGSPRFQLSALSPGSKMISLSKWLTYYGQLQLVDLNTQLVDDYDFNPSRILIHRTCWSNILTSLAGSWDGCWDFELLTIRRYLSHYFPKDQWAFSVAFNHRCSSFGWVLTIPSYRSIAATDRVWSSIQNRVCLFLRNGKLPMYCFQTGKIYNSKRHWSKELTCPITHEVPLKRSI